MKVIIAMIGKGVIIICRRVGKEGRVNEMKDPQIVVSNG